MHELFKKILIFFGADSIVKFLKMCVRENCVLVFRFSETSSGFIGVGGVTPSPSLPSRTIPPDHPGSPYLTKLHFTISFFAHQVLNFFRRRLSKSSKNLSEHFFIFSEICLQTRKICLTDLIKKTKNIGP